jgi:hypothetical protein
MTVPVTLRMRRASLSGQVGGLHELLRSGQGAVACSTYRGHSPEEVWPRAATHALLQLLHSHPRFMSIRV